MKASHTVRPVFDDPNLVGCAGLLPALLLGESAGLSGLLGEHLSVDSPNAVVKSTGVIARACSKSWLRRGAGWTRHG